MGERGEEGSGPRVGDLIAISPAPPVVSLSWLEMLRARLAAGGACAAELDCLLGGYLLDDPETKAAFEAVCRSLGRPEPRGDAFLVAGVYGSGKSHLLAALALLAGHPEQAWPRFLATHPQYARFAAGFAAGRLVAAIALDEYPAPSHPLEYIVFSRLEQELARHGARIALTEQSHLLAVVDAYVLPQVGRELDRAARETHHTDWPRLRARDPEAAAELAIAFLTSSRFPLDWRRSRAEAWAALRQALAAHQLDGPVVLLDELGMFLAGKDRAGLNADAAFLQYLAQRAAGERCWVVAVTQRGLDDAGDIDRRTLRQLRDRFRPGFTLGLSSLPRMIENRLVVKRDAEAFPIAVIDCWHSYQASGRDSAFSAGDLARTYPLNPLALELLQRAAETCLSRTRSVVSLLQEATRERDWLARPARRLITPPDIVDVFRDELGSTPLGRRCLHALEVNLAHAAVIAPGREQELALVMQALCLLTAAELRWPPALMRDSLVGGDCEALWQEDGLVEELLAALHRRGAYVERARRDGADEYFLALTSDASERIRQRLNELVADLALEDSRVARAALEACGEQTFPLAGLAERRSLSVEWWHARRFVMACCRDLTGLGAAELRNLAGALASPQSKEDGWLFLALPTAPAQAQEQAWRVAAGGLEERFAAALLAWLPRELSPAEQDQLIEHAALFRMLDDPTVARPRDPELRAGLRDRWESSQTAVQQLLRSAYHHGRVLAASGAQVMEPERLQSLSGQWEETLAALFASPFRTLFPYFPSIAPARRLAGRAQTNQIVDQFIRPGRVSLPPASTLEAHLLAYAAPLGLVEGETREFALALQRRELVEAALAAAPPRSDPDRLEPEEAISVRELIGRLGKSKWGITPEQAELLVAALVRTGYLVALDAFLEPTRLDLIAAPLGDNLPFVMRAAPLQGRAARAASALWQAAVDPGPETEGWDLPTQERAWRDLLAWAEALRQQGEHLRAALGQAAADLGGGPESWAWAREGLARAETLAAAMEPAVSSREGLTRLVAAAERLPGGLDASVGALATWRQCEQFLFRDLATLARLRRLVFDAQATCPEGSQLARERESLRSELALPKRLVAAAPGLAGRLERWLEAYRRHYLGWHGAAYAAARWESLVALIRSEELEASRRLARAGLGPSEAAHVGQQVAAALARRCLAGDPLPGGAVVCPQCGLRLGQGAHLPQAEKLADRVRQVLSGQLSGLRQQAGLLGRRLAGCAQEEVRTAVERLLKAGQAEAGSLAAALSEETIAWLSAQLRQPRAARRELPALAARLRGRELPAREVRRQVDEWLAAGDDEVVEVV